MTATNITPIFRLESLVASQYDGGDLSQRFGLESRDGYGAFGTGLKLDSKLTLGL